MCSVLHQLDTKAKGESERGRSEINSRAADAADLEYGTEPFLMHFKVRTYNFIYMKFLFRLLYLFLLLISKKYMSAIQ